MRREFNSHTGRQTSRRFLCAAVLCVAFSITKAATVEWCFLGDYPPVAPPPSSFVIVPAAPTIADNISFIAPANGEVYLNDIAAADAFGNPLISVDSTK